MEIMENIEKLRTDMRLDDVNYLVVVVEVVKVVVELWWGGGGAVGNIEIIEMR